MTELRRPPWSTWLLYFVGVVNTVLVFLYGGWAAGFTAVGGGACFWAAAILHERYTG